MSMDLLVVTNSKELLRQKSVVLKLKSFIEYDNFVIVGDDEVIKLVESDSSFEAMGIKCISASKLDCDIKNDDLALHYSKICNSEYYLSWDISIMPVRRFASLVDGHPYWDIYNGKLAGHLMIKTDIMRTIVEESSHAGLDQSKEYVSYVMNKCPDLYITRTWNIFEKAGCFFESDLLKYEDILWLSKDYDGIMFDKKDHIMPELSAIFYDDNYRSKLLPSQIYDAVKDEIDKEAVVVSSDETGYEPCIEQEIRNNNGIIICPFDEEGQYFKRILNEKYGIKEEFIIDNARAGETTKDGVRIVSVSDLAGKDMPGKVVIVNSLDYQKNCNYLIEIHNVNNRIAKSSLIGPVEVMLPSRKAFIEKVRELTEVKWLVSNKSYIRTGSERDGGYIMLDDFSSDMKAYSYGINDDVSWDKDVADRFDMDIYMYDHTIDGLPEENVHFHYFKKGVAGEDRPEELLYSLETCLADNGHLDSENLILKMDVEGAEWDVINKTPSEILGKFRQMAFEFHDFEKIEKEPEIISALEKLNETHVPVWVHGNNHSRAICTDEIILPIAFELLYLNKKYYEFEEKEVVFPWALDACNLDLFREHVLGNWGKRS